MPKSSQRAYSGYSQDAAVLLGNLIRLGRIERKLSAEQFAERAGLSRGLVHRIEKGDLGCSIGAVFEAAAVAGVRLFDASPATLKAEISSNAHVMTLLPQKVRASVKAVKDDF
jgi:transcriptional regulator with XRE-family HTH domain